MKYLLPIIMLFMYSFCTAQVDELIDKCNKLTELRDNQKKGNQITLSSKTELQPRKTTNWELLAFVKNNELLLLSEKYATPVSTFRIDYYFYENELLCVKEYEEKLPALKEQLQKKKQYTSLLCTYHFKGKKLVHSRTAADGYTKTHKEFKGADLLKKVAKTRKVLFR